MRGINLKIDTDEEVELEKGETVLKISELNEGERFRAAIFGTLGVLDFEPRNDVILTNEEMEIVQNEIMPKFPDLWMHDFWNPKVPGGIQIVSQRGETKKKVMAEIPTENAERSYSILHADNPNGLPDRDWDLFNRMMSRARYLAKDTGVEFVKKGPYHFFYDGHGIDWRNGGKNLITESELRDWKNRVDSGEFDEDEEAMTG